MQEDDEHGHLVIADGVREAEHEHAEQVVKQHGHRVFAPLVHVHGAVDGVQVERKLHNVHDVGIPRYRGEPREIYRQRWG